MGWHWSLCIGTDALFSNCKNGHSSTDLQGNEWQSA